MLNYLTKFETSKKLKELGISQNTSLFWYKGSASGHKPMIADENFLKPLENEIGKEVYSAYSVGELGVILPPAFGFSGKTYEDEAGDWICGNLIAKDNAVIYDEYEYGDTEAEARANMIIHIVEKNKKENEKRS